MRERSCFNNFRSFLRRLKWHIRYPQKKELSKTLNAEPLIVLAKVR